MTATAAPSAETAETGPPRATAPVPPWSRARRAMRRLRRFALWTPDACRRRPVRETLNSHHIQRVISASCSFPLWRTLCVYWQMLRARTLLCFYLRWHRLFCEERRAVKQLLHWHLFCAHKASVCVCLFVWVYIQDGLRPGRECCVPGSSCTKACIVFKEALKNTRSRSGIRLNCTSLVLTVRCIFN